MTTMTSPARTHAVHFVQPLPGFEGRSEFTLQAIDEDNTLFSMRALDDPSVRFVLTPSDRFFTDYSPDLDADAVSELGVADGDEVTVLLMLTIPTGLADATANLRAPVVVANDSGRAVQVVLDDDGLPMERPLVG